MSKKFLSYDDFDDIDDVSAEYPSAASIQEVEGGWMVFDSIDEFKTWLKQS